MKKVMIWFLLSCKRYVRKPSFLVILLLLPLGILAADKSQGHKDPEIKIAVSVQGGDENELGARLAQSLVERRLGEDAGMFRFYECRDEEQVKDEGGMRLCDNAGAQGKTGFRPIQTQYPCLFRPLHRHRVPFHRDCVCSADGNL